MTLRPTRGNVIAGWAMIAFGLLFGLASWAAFSPEPGDARDVGAGLAMLLFATAVASLGGSLVTAKAIADPTGLRYRYGLILRHVNSRDISAITVGPGSGVGYERLCIHVERSRGKAVRLTALQRPATAKSRAALEGQARELSSILLRQLE